MRVFYYFTNNLYTKRDNTIAEISLQISRQYGSNMYDFTMLGRIQSLTWPQAEQVT